MDKPITEQSNYVTKDIDVASANGIVRLLQQAESQIFSGYSLYEGVYDRCTQECINSVAHKAAEILKDPVNNAVVISGCGTSGRLAFSAVRTFSHLLGKNNCYLYLIAGGDQVLLQSSEAPEDDYQHGVDDLKKVTKGKTKVLFIGVSCGLSAPYVAGQLDYCLDHGNRFTAVLLGFNPSNMARKRPILNWDKSFYDVVLRMEGSSEYAHLLTPVIGPEPITGSTRMKGGTTTKILLEVIFSLAHLLLEDHMITSAITTNLIQCYELAWRRVCLLKEDISKAVQLAGESLLAGGNIYYVGCKQSGLIGLIDASECPPTFGASVTDVQGFIAGGYYTLRNISGDLSTTEGGYRIDLDHFRDHVIPTLRSYDLVVFTIIYSNTETDDCLSSLLQAVSCKTVIVMTTQDNAAIKVPTMSSDVIVHLQLPTDTITMLCSHADHMIQCVAQMGIKWVLNALTTGAHVIKGKVVRNLMVDVQVSNSKLFHRAVGIIKDVAMVTDTVAKHCLLCSIYEVDQLPSNLNHDDIISHIQKATRMDKVVPVALLLAQTSQHYTVQTAKDALHQDPIVRRVITTN